MPTITTPISSELILVLDNGVGVSGQPLSKQRIYKNISTQADATDLLAVAEKIVSLQSRTKQAVRKRDVIEIEDDLDG